MTIWKYFFVTSKIGRFLFGKFLKIFFVLSISLIAIVCTVDYFENLDCYIKFQPTSHELWIQYQLNLIIYLFHFLSPLIVFITTMLVMRSLRKHGELMAMLSCGLTRKSVHFLIIQISILLTVLSFILGAFVVPNANFERSKFKIKYIDGDPELSDNLHLMITDSSKIYFEKFDYENTSGSMFAYEEFENSSLKKIIKADKANWNDSKNGWSLKNYTQREYDGQTEKLFTGDSILLNIPFGEIEIHDVVKGLESFSLPQLIAASKDPRYNSLRQEREFEFFLNEKFTFPFATIVFCLLGLAFSMGSVHSNTVTQIVLGFFFCFSYWALLQFSFGLVTDKVNPTIALWTPNIIILIAVLFQFRLSTSKSS